MLFEEFYNMSLVKVPEVSSDPFFEAGVLGLEVNY